METGREEAKVIDRARGRGPGLLYQTAIIGLLVVIALVALTAARDVPPAIAELAPQAVEQIKESPDEHAAASLEDDGRAESEIDNNTDANEDDTTGPQDPETTEPSVYKCVGNPPRQIEDPQSPPCVPFWDMEKGNGGSTAPRGVSGDEIIVAVGRYTLGEVSIGDADIKLFEDFFNKRFQFYGRRLRLVGWNPSLAPTAAQMDSEAETVKETGAFATLSYPERNGSDYVFWDALARHKIIGIGPAANYTGYSTEADFARNRPYQWSYLPGWDRLQRSMAEFICKQLKGYQPRHARGAQATAPVRKFGIVNDEPRPDLPPPSIKLLEDELRRCGAPFKTYPFSTRDVATTMHQLRTDGVTTVLFHGHTSTYSVRFTNAATGQGFTPEYLVWNNGHQDDDEAAEYYQSYAESVIGMQSWNRTLGVEDLPSTWAIKEIDPTALPRWELEYLYKPLLLLASGIQMAGPNLTPETFEQGLFRTRFPNPGAGQAPYYQAWVGFPGGLHNMVHDQTRIWLGRNAVSPFTGRPPSYCYIDRGTRFRLGGWPQEEAHFFQGPCR